MASVVPVAVYHQFFAQSNHTPREVYECPVVRLRKLLIVTWHESEASPKVKNEARPNIVSIALAEVSLITSL